MPSAASPSEKLFSRISIPFSIGVIGSYTLDNRRTGCFGCTLTILVSNDLGSMSIYTPEISDPLDGPDRPTMAGPGTLSGPPRRFTISPQKYI
jgi:hypothetical protein